MQAKEQAKQREKEEEQRKAVEKVRIEKEAAAQRALAAKKKEAQTRKAAVAADRQQPMKTTRSMPISKAKVSKSTFSSKLYYYGMPIGAGVALCVSAGMLYFLNTSS
ncbi:MAG: hypothetical protein HC767_11710 [Akkermansiaceae bacterium]|nr:hypothetical protein [Akkermansiaceae bacterium]